MPSELHVNVSPLGGGDVVDPPQTQLHESWSHFSFSPINMPPKLSHKVFGISSKHDGCRIPLHTQHAPTVEV